MGKPSQIARVGMTVALAAVSGCVRTHRGEALQAPQFGVSPRTQKPMDADPLSAADQPGALYENARNDVLPPNQLSPDQQAAQQVEGLSKTVQENVTAPGVSGGEQAATPITTQPAALANGNPRRHATSTQAASVGEFFTIGGVVAEVNSTPIYANKVLNLVEPVLAARAKELDEERFKIVAQNELRQQMYALRNYELEYAAAEKNLDQRDKELADMLTLDWRRRQITEAGGSEELARKNAPEIARRNRLNPNSTFDELVKEMYRVHMSQVFYQKKIMPRVRISAQEMRDYYEVNREQLFTQRGSAQFRLIKIDVKRAGGRDAAMRKISEIRNRIVKAGEPFEISARETNDNPLLLKTGGSVKVDQGAFAVKQVDDAVWSTPEGQVTDIIDAGDALYIAQVLERKPGNVQPFEDEAVQVRIREDLFSREFKEMRRKVQQQLEETAVIRSDPAMMNTALEMAMQNYPKWAGK